MLHTLSLHDALPIFRTQVRAGVLRRGTAGRAHRAEARDGQRQRDLVRPRHRLRPGLQRALSSRTGGAALRSEEHTSELQSPCNIVCRLLLEKKNQMRELLESRIIIETEATRLAATKRTNNDLINIRNCLE